MTSPEPMEQTQVEAAEGSYWARLYGRWEPLDLTGVADFMAGFDRPWWVVGGWAIDAFTRGPRQHDDVDVSIFATDVAALRAHVGGRWHLWNLAGGDMRPLTDRHPEVFDPASQVWVREHGDAPWVLDVPLTPDADGLWTNKFMPDHRGLIDDVTWEADDGIRYLSPEIVLWFKARNRRTKDEQDFLRTWPLLRREHQDWLRTMIRRGDDSHPWLSLTDGWSTHPVRRRPVRGTITSGRGWRRGSRSDAVVAGTTTVSSTESRVP